MSISLIAYKEPTGFIAYLQGSNLSEIDSRPDPSRYWLQLGDDASTEMYITWQELQSEYTQTVITYRKRGDTFWLSATGTSEFHPFTGGIDQPDFRLIHRVKLTDLDPGTEYEFRFSHLSPIRYFKTLPSFLSSEVRMVTCADILYTQDYEGAETMAGHIADVNPDFVNIPGDWAYDDGLESRFGRWDTLWDILTRKFTKNNGRVIPIVPGIGNHEVVGGYSNNKENSRYFYKYFYFPEDHAGAYRHHRAGNWLSLIVLDTEHTSGNYSGSTAQEQWLNSTLGSVGHVKHKVVTMHAPYYTSRRDPQGSPAVRGRTHIAPILENAGVRTVYQAHEHIYARTVRIKNDQIDETGIKYFGDGNWSVNIETASNADKWWVEAAYGNNSGPIETRNPTRARHFHLTRFTNTALTNESYDSTGELFHTYTDDAVSSGKRVRIIGKSSIFEGTIFELE